MLRLCCLYRRAVATKSLIMMVQLGGLEPPTSGSTDRRSNQLSYSCTGSASGAKLGAARSYSKAYGRRKVAPASTLPPIYQVAGTDGSHRWRSRSKKARAQG